MTTAMADGKMRVWRFLFPLLELPGLAVIFLPFASEYSPYDTLVEFISEAVAIVAAPFLLAVPILASTVRQLIGGGPSKVETRIGYGLAASALLASVVFTIMTFDGEFWAEWLTFCASGWVAVLAALTVCILNVREGVPHAVNAHVCLLCAYVPNALIALVAFRDHLQSGAYVCLVAVAAYIGEAVVLTTRAMRCAGRETGPGISSQPGEE